MPEALILLYAYGDTQVTVNIFFLWEV